LNPRVCRRLQLLRRRSHEREELHDQCAITWHRLQKKFHSNPPLKKYATFWGGVLSDFCFSKRGGRARARLLLCAINETSDTLHQPILDRFPARLRSHRRGLIGSCGDLTSPRKGTASSLEAIVLAPRAYPQSPDSSKAGLQLEEFPHKPPSNSFLRRNPKHLPIFLRRTGAFTPANTPRHRDLCRASTTGHHSRAHPHRPAPERVSSGRYGNHCGGPPNDMGSDLRAPRAARRERANVRSVDMKRVSIGAISLTGSIVLLISRPSNSA
jgi:hypothetical protein